MSFYLDSDAKPDFSGMQPIGGANYDPAQNAGFFDHLGQEALSGIYRGALNIAEVTNLAAANILPAVDLIRGDESATNAYYSRMVDPIEREKHWLDNEARDAGTVAHLAGGVTEFGTEILPAGVSSLVASQAIGRTASEVKKGTPLPVAYELGAVQGGIAGVGAMLPIRIPLVSGAGPAALQRIAYGAFTGGALGVVEPGLESQVYMSGGMPAEAAKIDPLNAKQIILNAALGGFLGLAAHRYPGFFGAKPDEAIPAPAKAPPAPLVDAAMVANGQQHLGAYAKAAETPAAGAEAITELRNAGDDGIPITQVGIDAPVKPEADDAMQQGARDIGAALGIEGESPRPTINPQLDLLPTAPESIAGSETALPPAAAEPLPAKTAEATSGWSPRGEDGATLPISFQELQGIAKRLQDAGIEIPSEIEGQAAKSAVDSIAQSVEQMKKSDFYQSVIDEAANCILSGGLGE